LRQVRLRFSKSHKFCDKSVNVNPKLLRSSVIKLKTNVPTNSKHPFIEERVKRMLVALKSPGSD
jgi:hypothetical protein